MSRTFLTLPKSEQDQLLASQVLAKERDVFIRSMQVESLRLQVDLTEDLRAKDALATQLSKAQKALAAAEIALAAQLSLLPEDQTKKEQMLDDAYYQNFNKVRPEELKPSIKSVASQAADDTTPAPSKTKKKH